MKHLKKYESFSVNEGIIGTTLLTLGGLGVVYLARKVKKFLDAVSIFGPAIRLAPFKKKIENIENSTDGGEVIIKNKDGVYAIIIKDDKGSVVDYLVLDRNENKLYDDDKMSQVIIPAKLIPKIAKDEEATAEIRKMENELLEDFVKIIEKYSK